MNNRILFEMIKDHKWDEFIEYIKDNEDIDVNIRDASENYLINYAIMFNKIEAVSILIHRGSKLDITDNDGRSILYVPIKYGFDKVLNLLLHFNQTNIGISLIDIQDKNQNIPLHYAIYTNNMDALKLLLEYQSNVNATDAGGMNSLQMAIMNRNLEATKLILQKAINVNNRSTTGETALHMACNLQLYEEAKLLIEKGININIQDYDHEFTALDYCIVNNDVKLTALLLKNNADINTQDFFGNTPIHYSIKEENYEIVNLIIRSKFTINLNYNLYNIDSEIPIHFLLEKEFSKIENFVEPFLQNSDLNFQDINNISPMHYIASTGIWKKYKSILEKKKLDIFLKNNAGKRPIDYISKEDIDEFIELVINSYMFILKNGNFTWNTEWENMCNKELFIEKMPESDLAKLKKYFDQKKVKKGEDVCRHLIKNKLMEIYESKDAKCNYSSYPSKLRKKCIDLEVGDKVEICTFTGASLDVLFGLIYLLQKYDIACSTLDRHFDNNEELCKYYRSIGMKVGSKCEFVNFEIIWVLQKMYFSSNFIDNFKKCNVNNKKRFVIIPLGIELQKGSHANYLIYDKKTKELERFEPYGSSPPYQFDYNPNLLDNILKYKFTEIDEDIKYIKPSDYMPKIGFQYFDVLEGSTGKIGDPGGFCALWSIWYADHRMKYPDVPRQTLTEKLIKNIKIKNLSFKNIIRNYSKDILQIRDKVLNNAGLTINDWINDEYTNEQFNQIIQEITKLIIPLS